MGLTRYSFEIILVMAPTLQSLPVEILDNVLDQLRVDPVPVFLSWGQPGGQTQLRLSLKNLRLTCKQIHAKTIKNFARAYFTNVTVCNAGAQTTAQF
jgi:hypothetical protein